jgi:hypothetical protein
VYRVVIGKPDGSRPLAYLGVDGRLIKLECGHKGRGRWIQIRIFCDHHSNPAFRENR